MAIGVVMLGAVAELAFLAWFLNRSKEEDLPSGEPAALSSLGDLKEGELIFVDQMGGHFLLLIQSKGSKLPTYYALPEELAFQAARVFPGEEGQSRNQWGHPVPILSRLKRRQRGY